MTKRTEVKPGPYDFWPAGVVVTVEKVDSSIGTDYVVYADDVEVGRVESTKVHPGTGTTLNLQSEVTRWSATSVDDRFGTGFIYVTRRDAIGTLL